MTILTTDRLTLSPVAVSDMQDLTALGPAPDFPRHIMGRGLSEEEVWFRLLRDLGHWQAKGYGNWSIRETETGDYVGSVGVLDYRREMTPAFDAPELGWGVAPAFQGQGLAYEALQAALAWTDAYRLEPRTVCMISLDNAPSAKLAERVGYRPYAEANYKGSLVTLFERPRTVAG
ncbi:GNAT family N-acetyltransferase [uncultured Brevundimonas sp.]|uniref:GNAT family N-acetyltransferase n=2 Tax=uncultured Brevundimonas sp. TaxID=213418 RepID=UPI0026182172|nr:GNAT family N-acetyltransferase [uncultured Brevundimonas sp.]